jgi:hypothetical protein
LTKIYRLSGMKSFRDDLNDRMKTGWGRFVLASVVRGGVEVRGLIMSCCVLNYGL